MDYSYWRLKESPFRFGVDTKGFFLSGIHEEALARLEFLVEQQRRLGLLVGPAGTGKSLLLEVFAGKIRRAGRLVVHVSAAGAKTQELLWDLLFALGRTPKPEVSIGILWRQLFDRLREARLVQVPVVILWDDVEAASEEGRQVIARLLGYTSRSEAALTVVLSGRPEILSQLDSRLLDRVDLRIELASWELSETEQYLQEALTRAGRSEPIFTSEATVRLYELAQGIPRQIAQLAELALLAGAVQGIEQIDADTVEGVYQELGLGTAHFG